MKKLLVVLVAALAAGCATPVVTSVPTMEALAAAQTDGSAVLIINTSGELQCDQTILGIHRFGEQRNNVLWTLHDPGYRTSQPAILVTPPGRFRISGGSCFRSGYYPGEMGSVRYWFGHVDVAAGEVVYLGTLQSNLTAVEAQLTESQQFWDSFMLGPDTRTNRYPSYEFVDQSSDVLERLRNSHPDLAARMVVRSPPQLLQPSDFAAAVRAAYAPGADGARPTLEVAQARLHTELTTLLERVAAEHAEEPAAAAPSVQIPAEN